MLILWFLTAVCAIISTLQFAATVTSAESAPQQAAGAAIAAAGVIIPYVFTRAIEGFLIVYRKS